MGFIKNLFSGKKKKEEMSAEEKAKLEELLNEKKSSEEEYEEEYVDDISFPDVSVNKSIQEKSVINEPKEDILKKEDKKVETIKEKVNSSQIVNNKVEDLNKMTEDKKTNIEGKKKNIDYNNLEDLNYEDIVRMKELLNKKEREIQEKEKNSVKKDNTATIKEISIDFSDKDKKNDKKYHEYEIYETSEYGVDALSKINVTGNVSFSPSSTGQAPYVNLKKKEEVLVIEDDDTEKSSLELNGEVINKLRNIFTDENVFFKESRKINYDILKGEEVTCIGIRKKEAYFSWESVIEQNSWFISEIKKFDDLKNFKVIRSEDGIKDLVWNKDHPILICFRSINHLPNQDFFGFPEEKK